MIDKKFYDTYLDDQMDRLWEIAQYVHENPEICYEEYKACEVQCQYLSSMGFQVKKGIEDIPTAYIAKYGREKPNIAIISEYDALPQLGHACGHNLICTASMGAAVEVKKYMEDSRIEGTLYVIGTPAEESGGGKIELLGKGIFDEIDAVLMMHPTSDKTRLAGKCMSSMRLEFVFKGKAAHAGSHPEDGINALSAANLYFAATGFLRQHFKSDMRLSGIISDGGVQTGLIPDYVKVSGSMSSFHLADLKENVERIKHCAQGSAYAMGCEVEIQITQGYQGRVPNKVLADVCRKELEDLGEPLLDGMPADFGGEDLGNVSRLIPVCNPYVTIFPDYKISNHTTQFRELANSKAGYRCIQIAAKAMARTTMELLENTKIIDKAKQELKKHLEKE